MWELGKISKNRSQVTNLLSRYRPPATIHKMVIDLFLASRLEDTFAFFMCVVQIREGYLQIAEFVKEKAFQNRVFGVGKYTEEKT